MDKKITLLGNGSWSSALAKILTDNGHKVQWWMRSKEAIDAIRLTAHNPHYLTSVKYDTTLLHLHHDICEAIEAGDLIIIGIPSAFVAEALTPCSLNVFQNKIVLSAIKGILPGKNVLLNEYLQEQFDVNIEHYGCISGPCHAEEVAAEKLSYLTFASANLELSRVAASLFTNHYLQTVVSNDVYGVQYAAVLKNIYALGAGIAHGLDYGDNFLSVYITNCFSELQQFMDVISTQTRHHYNTSAYLGDLLVTCYSLHSRNRTFGNFIGRGYTANAARLELGMVAEGYVAARGIYEICEKIQYALPIAGSIYAILWQNKAAIEEFKKIEGLCS